MGMEQQRNKSQALQPHMIYCLSRPSSVPAKSVLVYETVGDLDLFLEYFSISIYSGRRGMESFGYCDSA